MPELISITQFDEAEKPYDRKLRMLKQLSRACTACSMCELGLKCAEKDGQRRDPHVFSNMKPHRIMLVGQNPGWNELKLREPFVGAAGRNFDEEIAKHGMSRDEFYICNTVRCWTQGNAKPTEKNKQRCEPFLRMEIHLIKPLLIVALGAVAFSQLCPEHAFGESLKQLKASKYGVKVFPIYHPSPMNFRNGSRRSAFEGQIRIMCKLVKAIKTKHGD